MFLQLADNDFNTMSEDNYDVIRTNQGNLFIRKDLSEETKKNTRAQKVSKITGTLGKVTQFAPIPGAQAISKGFTTASQISGKIATNKPSETKTTITASLPKKTFSLTKSKGTTPTATMPTAIMPTATMPVVIEQKDNFFKRYRMPLLIGGGIFIIGASFLLLRKRK